MVDSDLAASLGARGCSLDKPGSLGAALHRSADVVRQHHQAELSSRVDVLCAMTADTTPRALAESGMEHRAARLTGEALDVVLELTRSFSRPVAVAGVLGSAQVTATARARFEEELHEHAERIAVGGAQLFLVRGLGSRLDLVLAVAAASSCDVPVWAVVDSTVPEGDLLGAVESLTDAGAEAVLLEVASVDDGLERIRRVRDADPALVLGALLSAGPDALRGYPSPLVAGWVDRVVELTDAGARIVGGGAGTTEAHTAALATRLGILHPSISPPRSPGF